MTVRPRDDVALMDGYHSPQLEVAVRLNTNEAPEPPPDEFVDQYIAAIHSISWNRYPDRSAIALRSALGDLHGYSADQIFVANGSNEVIQTLLLAFGGAGRTVGVWEPTYALHSHIARLTGTRVAEGERSIDFEIKIDEVERVLYEQKPSIIFLCTPNNPTGLADKPESIQAVIDLAVRNNALLVVDEAYGQFADHTALDLVSEDLPLVVTRTFSKTWSMAAARLGYLVGPKWVVEELNKVVLPYHLDSLKQLAGLIAVRFVDEMEARVSRLVDDRERLVSRLQTLPVTVWPSQANFVLFRPETADGAFVWRELVERSVLVRNCSSWPRLAGCLRVTIGTPDENDLFLTALEEILA